MTRNAETETSARSHVTRAGAWLVGIRHAPVAATGVCYGRTDLPTTLSDEAAAQAVAERLPWLPAAIWTSPLRRCAAPAKRLAERLGVPVTTDDRLRELDYGRWDGRPWAEIDARDGGALAAWMRDWIGGRPPGGESPTELERRVAAWLGERSRIPTVAITHAGVIRALRVILDGVSWPDSMSTDVPHLVPVMLGG